MSRPKMVYTPESALARDAEYFWPKVDKHGGFPDFSDPLVRVTEADGECWVWTGFRDENGYGKFRSVVFGAAVGAHRVAYLLTHGIRSTESSPIDHLCRNTACCRHLECVTSRVNSLRGAGPTAENAAKVFCIHGHEFTPENTMAHGPNGRKCRECHRRLSLRYVQRQREVAAA